MAASLWDKIRALTLGNLHELLDAAIDLNSVAAIKQFCRDLERAKDQIQNEAAAARARLGSVKGEARALEAKLAQDNEHIDLILGDDDPSNDHVAEPIQARVIENEKQLELLKEQVNVAQQASDGLAEATRKIIAKHAEMVANIRRLEALERTAKAKEQATGALEMAGKAITNAGSVSVDDVERRLHDKAGLADERFKDALAGASGGEEADTIAGIEAKRRLAERRAKLAAQKPGTAAPAAA